uniref:UmuC domain-containing protein n=1 Tax=Macrostomum lignano TaxID=282301 RepID=A0A1I8FNZ3_9PLAT
LREASCGSLHPVLVRGGLLQLCGSGLRRSQRHAAWPARELCPELVAVPYEFEAYEAASSQLYRLLGEFTRTAFRRSAAMKLFVDCGELLRETGASPAQLASLVRKEVQERTGGCTASCGLGPNLLVARLATKQAKPDGQRVLLDPAGIAELLRDLPVRELPGVGRALEARLTSLGFGTCGLLRGAQVSALGRELGPRVAQTLLDAANGRDDRRGAAERERRKSISAEINYGETAKFGGHGVCNTVNKSVALPLDTDDARLLLQECMIIVRQLRLAPAGYARLGHPHDSTSAGRLPVPAEAAPAEEAGGPWISAVLPKRLILSLLADLLRALYLAPLPVLCLAPTSGFMSGGRHFRFYVRRHFGSMSAHFRFYVRRHFRFYAWRHFRFYVPRHFRGSMSGVTSGSIRPTSGSMSRRHFRFYVRRHFRFYVCWRHCFRRALLAASYSIPSVRRQALLPVHPVHPVQKLLGRKASSNCYSNDRNKVTGKANFFANAAGPSLIEDEEGDERADSPAAPLSSGLRTQYDLSPPALFDYRWLHKSTKISCRPAGLPWPLLSELSSGTPGRQNRRSGSGSGSGGPAASRLPAQPVLSAPALPPEISGGRADAA